MAHSVLITQCLQEDFVGPVAPHDPIPNRLHVGQREAMRLLGTQPAVGPLGQLMANVRAQPEEEIQIFHIRDWHDSEDPRQRDHLDAFGPHCLRESTGARLVLNLEHEARERRNEHVVDSITLNDFEGTTLDEQLRGLKAGVSEGELRVGVVGVWTDAKVSFLLYDLKTRLGIDKLATCSALTASASRSQHFNALEQLERILGVACFESVGDFIAWLLPGKGVKLPPASHRQGPRLEIPGEPVNLSAVDRDLLAYLYADSAKVALEALSGGFSGALVCRATAYDALGHRQAPSVVKLGPNRLIAKERVTFERVEEILGNHAPRIRSFVDLGERAGIKYSYAAMGQGPVRTLKSMFDGETEPAELERILRVALEEVLGAFYAAARYERLPLLAHYGFSPNWAGAVRTNVEAIMGDQTAERVFEFPGGYRARNVCSFYEEFLPTVPEFHSDFHYVSYVHGDLNGANVLIDARDNVWVIDYFHTGPGHVLKDLAKLENDLLYIFTEVTSEEELAQALLITRALRQVEDLRAPLAETPVGLESPSLRRAYQMVRVLREIGGRICREDRHPLQMDVALLRYAVHTLGFEESSPLQKRWALAAACGFAEDIWCAAEQERVLRVDWVQSTTLGRETLGLTICPGRRDRGRNLDADLGVLESLGVCHLICLLTEDELAWAGVSHLAQAAGAHGLTFTQLPVPDQGVPSMGELEGLLAETLTKLDHGEKVVVHCLGGLGRAGVAVACCLVAKGMSAEEAIVEVRRARGPRALETHEQEQFVVRYEVAQVRG